MDKGGRTSQAIVEGALTALRSVVKDRLSGKSGSSGQSKQARSALWDLLPILLFVLKVSVVPFWLISRYI